ncbi:MAG: hypothetical protein R2697_17345 [Ilumatobacteraceae bacterium]
MRPRRWYAVVLVLTACAAQPSDDSVGSTPPAGSAAATAPAVATTTPATAAPTVAPTTAAAPTTTNSIDPRFAPLVGRWAHYDVVAYEDGTLKTLIISYGFNDFSVVDGELIDQGSFCFSEQRTDQPIETSLSDAATLAIQPPPTPVAVEEVDDTLRLTRPATPTPVGIELGDPANEPLPTDPNDPHRRRRR